MDFIVLFLFILLLFSFLFLLILSKIFIIFVNHLIIIVTFLNIIKVTFFLINIHFFNVIFILLLFCDSFTLILVALQKVFVLLSSESLTTHLHQIIVLLALSWAIFALISMLDIYVCIHTSNFIFELIMIISIIFISFLLMIQSLIVFSFSSKWDFICSLLLGQITLIFYSFI